MIGRGGSGREGAFPLAVVEAFERRQNRRRCGLPGGAEALRIVDEDIERAEPLDRFGDRSGDLTRIAALAYPPHRFAARRRDLAERRVDATLRARSDTNRRAAARQ